MRFYGKRLRLIRFYHDISQADLAKKLGLSKQTINRFETGDLQPSEVVHAGMVKMFNLRDDFFTIHYLSIPINGDKIIGQL